jgi:hypothetical protein
MLLTGGQYLEDKTCSQQCFSVDLDNALIEDTNCSLQQPRMNHSMLAIEEKGLVLALCGQDESGNLLDTCEAYFE